MPNKGMPLMRLKPYALFENKHDEGPLLLFVLIYNIYIVVVLAIPKIAKRG